MSSYEHVQETFRHVVDLPDRERIAFLDEQRWVEYEVATTVIDYMRELMERPSKPRMPNLLITSESNNGKTTIVRRFVELYGKGYVTETGAVKPVILTQAANAKERELYLGLLDRFYAPIRFADSIPKLKFQVIHLFREHRVRMLIIDEMHSLLIGPRAKQEEIMGVIKFLCNELNIPIVGFGTQDAVNVLHSDAQHAKRFTVMKMPLWKRDIRFQRLLASYERVLPLKRPSNLGRTKMLAGLLHSYSEGNLGDLFDHIVLCAKAAIRSGQEFIDEQTIRDNAPSRDIARGYREIVL